MEENKIRQRKKPLRVVHPSLYEYIITEFATDNIHSYDILLEGETKDQGIQITIKFGENYAYHEVKFLRFKAIEEQSDELTQFVETAAENCKEVMIEEYFKMMAP